MGWVGLLSQLGFIKIACLALVTEENKNLTLLNVYLMGELTAQPNHIPLAMAEPTRATFSGLSENPIKAA